MKIFLKKLIEAILKKYGYKVQNIDNDIIEEITPGEKKLMELCSKYTMTSDLRKWALIQSFYHITNNNIEGDFVECGIWKGGNLILLQKLIEIANINNRKIYGFDTFTGMPKPSQHDFKTNNKNVNNFYKKDWLYVTEDEVRNNFKTNVNNDQNLILIKGKVEETLKIKSNIPNKISILRLDTDFYESTKIELEVLFERLSKGGILIIDDYGSWQGAKKAVDEYFFNQNIWLHYIDHDGRLMIKK